MKNSLALNPLKSVKQGQVWQLGKHRLLVGDAMDPTLVGVLMNGMKIDAIVTDPPYGVRYVESKEGIATPKKNKVIKNDDITDEPAYQKFSEAWLRVAIPHLAKKNVVYIFNCDKMLFALREAMRSCGIYFSQLVVWVKNQATLARKDYAPQHELILYGWHGTHIFRKAKDKSVLFFPKPHKSAAHPTIKPRVLVSHLILNATSIGGVVYDPFLGSGTAIYASERTGRVCYGVEIEVEYAEGILRQFERMTGQVPVLVYETNEG